MAVSTIVLNGTIQQTNDVLLNHTREQHKSALDQGHILAQEVHQEHQKAQRVVHSDESRFQQERYDAKEKGHGSYQGDGGKRKNPEKKDGKVVKKYEGGFDIKI